MTGVEIAVEAIPEPGWNVCLPLSIVYRRIVLVGDDEENQYFIYSRRRIDALVGKRHYRFCSNFVTSQVGFCRLQPGLPNGWSLWRLRP
jgi:hypothetical protein